MKFNQKQNEALEGIYRTARIYTKIAAELNGLADRIRLDGEEASEEYVKILTKSNALRTKDMMSKYVGLPKYTEDRLNDLIKEF